MAGSRPHHCLNNRQTRWLECATVTDALRAFADHQRRRNLRSGTIQRRERTLLELQRWLPAPLLEATPGDIEQWLDDCNLSAGSRYTYIGTLRAFYGWCRDVGLVADDPTSKLERPRLPRRLPRPIPMDRLRDAFDQADPRMRAWLLLAGFEGLRCFEIAHLRREDVRVTARPPTLFVSDGKGGHQRELPLHPMVEEALRPFLNRRGWLWTSERTGRPFLPGTVSTYIARHLHRCGLVETAHQARHLFATEVYRISRDLRLTQEFLGHADPKTTAIYTQLADAERAEVIDKLRW